MGTVHSKGEYKILKLGKTREKCVEAKGEDTILGIIEVKVKVTIVDYRGIVVMNYVKAQFLC